MQILALVTDAFGGHGGIAKFNRDLLTALCSNPDVDEVVALPRLLSESHGTLPPRLRYVESAARGKLWYVLEVMRALLRMRGCALIVCGHINLLSVGWAAKVISGARLALVVYGIEAWRPGRNALTKRLIGQVDTLVSISEFTRERFLSWAKRFKAPTFILPCAVDFDQFGAGPKCERLLERYGIRGRTVIMTLARLSADERYKGIDEVLELLPSLAVDIPDLSYLIVGDGTDRRRLLQKARCLGLSVCDATGDAVAGAPHLNPNHIQPPSVTWHSVRSDAPQVVFAGRIPDEEKADHYRLADAFVMPGRGEGFGIVYLEALACGIPVVATNADGSREALRQGELGILVNPNDSQSIRTGIVEALKHRGRVVPAGLDYFSIQRFESRVQRILAEVLAPVP